MKFRFFKLWGFLFLFLVSFFLQGCLLGYLVHVGSHQGKLLLKRKSLDRVLKRPDLDEKVKKKLELVREVLLFSKEKLNLRVGKHYKTYVDLRRPYVTYIVRVAQAYELKPYLWNFPIVGRLPYKGFFSFERAKKEALKFDSKKYDTYVRGVRAYSSLGWWNEPILSSFLSYEERDLVETVIHELVHSTIFIKGHADFNERLATALSNQGVLLFYLQKEGNTSENLIQIQRESQDQKTFSQFISKEINDLSEWYLKHKGEISLALKKERLLDIQRRFKENLKKSLNTSRFDFFEKIELNNARLLSFRTYVYDLSEFDFLFKFYKNDFKQVLSFLKSLESKANPELFFKNFVQKESK